MTKVTLKTKIKALEEHGYKVVDLLDKGLFDEVKINTLYSFHCTSDEEELSPLLINKQEDSETQKEDEQYEYRLKMKNKLQLERYSLYNTNSKNRIISVEGIRFIEGNSVTHNLTFEQCEQLVNKARDLFEEGILQFDNTNLNKYFGKIKTYSATKNLTKERDIDKFITELKVKHKDNYGNIREEIQGYKRKLAPKHIEMLIQEFDKTL